MVKEYHIYQYFGDDHDDNEEYIAVAEDEDLPFDYRHVDGPYYSLKSARDRIKEINETDPNDQFRGLWGWDFDNTMDEGGLY